MYIISVINVLYMYYIHIIFILCSYYIHIMLQRGSIQDSLFNADIGLDESYISIISLCKYYSILVHNPSLLWRSIRADDAWCFEPLGQAAIHTRI